MTKLTLKHIIISNNQGPLCTPIDLILKQGEVATLMGKSGCGKSTLLSAIAGHLEPYFHLEGDILLDDQSILDLPAHQRRIGILFQDDMLFPHLNIWQNLAFSLPAKTTKKARKQRALEVLEQIELSKHANKQPEQLSGGQRARVSLMRALLAEPKVLLLDEPFSKLDLELRQTFRQFVFEQLTQTGITTLMVTHDKHDAPENGTLFNWPNA